MIFQGEVTDWTHQLPRRWRTERQKGNFFIAVTWANSVHCLLFLFLTFFQHLANFTEHQTFYLAIYLSREFI